VRRAPRQRGLKVCLLSQHPLVLEELRRSLADSGIHLISQRSVPPTTVDARQIKVPRAAVYVIDAHAPRPATEALVAAIQARRHDPHLLFVAQKFDKASAFGLLHMGAKGLLSYPEARGQLPRALRAVAKGGFWVPRALLSSFVDSILRAGHKGRRSSRSARLSPREIQVLNLMLDNLSNKEIASQMKIAERTVKFHVSNVLTKFGVHRRADLILLWYQQHLM
jgi:two-component system, NarL family, response regulator, fimbrial Z protein, FimZ